MECREVQFEYESHINLPFNHFLLKLLEKFQMFV